VKEGDESKILSLDIAPEQIWWRLAYELRGMQTLSVIF
jgi:hypothetical protein